MKKIEGTISQVTTNIPKAKASIASDDSSAQIDSQREHPHSFLAQVEKADAARVRLFEEICQGNLSHPAVRFCYKVATLEEMPELPENEEDMAIAAITLTIGLCQFENLDDPVVITSFDESLEKVGFTSVTSRRDTFADIVKNRRLLLFRTRRAIAELFRCLDWGEPPPEGFARELVQALKYGRRGTC